MPKKKNYTHDSGYKLLFSNHELVRQLITSFVTDDWVNEIEHLCFCYGPEALNEPISTFLRAQKSGAKKGPSVRTFLVILDRSDAISS